MLRGFSLAALAAMLALVIPFAASASDDSSTSTTSTTNDPPAAVTDDTNIVDCAVGSLLSSGSTSVSISGSTATAVVTGWAFCGETVQTAFAWSTGAASQSIGVSPGQCVSVTAYIGSASNGLAWQQSASGCAPASGGGGGGGGGGGSAPSVRVTSSSATVSYGATVDVSWTATDASANCSISGGGLSQGGFAYTGTKTTQALTVNPTVVSVACSNAYGTGSGQVSITVNPPVLPACSNGWDDDGDGLTDYPSDPGCTSASDTDEYNPPPAPTVTLTPSATTIAGGDSLTLSWSSTNASSCNNPWTTSTATSGSQTVSPTSTTSYTRTCSGAGGTASSNTVTVTVIDAQALSPYAGGSFSIDQGSRTLSGGMPCRNAHVIYTYSNFLTHYVYFRWELSETFCWKWSRVTAVYNQTAFSIESHYPWNFEGNLVQPGTGGINTYTATTFAQGRYQACAAFGIGCLRSVAPWARIIARADGSASFQYGVG